MAIMQDLNYYWSNITLDWPEGLDGNVRDSDADEHYRTLLAYFVVTAAVVGFVLNCFVIVLSVFYVQVYCSFMLIQRHMAFLRLAPESIL